MARRHREILDVVLDRMVEDRYPVNEMLPKEELLAEEFEIARGTAREVYRALEERRVAVVKHGRGARVLPREEWNVIDPAVGRALARGRGYSGFRRELTDYRRLLEGEAAALAAERASARQRATLRSAASVVSDSESAQRIRRLVALASGNRPLAATLRALADIESPGFRPADVDACRCLALAVADGDRQAARAASDALGS